MTQRLATRSGPAGCLRPRGAAALPVRRTGSPALSISEYRGHASRAAASLAGLGSESVTVTVINNSAVTRTFEAIQCA